MVVLGHVLHLIKILNATNQNEGLMSDVININIFIAGLYFSDCNFQLAISKNIAVCTRLLMKIFYLCKLDWTLIYNIICEKPTFHA